MDLIQVDLTRCTRCGLCARICPYVVLDVDMQKGPYVIRDNCIACGHCVAVCPEDAIDNRKSPRSGQRPAPETVLDEKTAADFLRSRRTIRWYRKRRVSRRKIEKMLDMARFAPTGSNSQGISWLIIDNPEIIHAASDAVIAWEKETLEINPHASPLFDAQIERYSKKREDSILFNAPCLVIALSRHDLPKRVRENAILCMIYAQLYAPSLGLGTCWAGVLEGCVNAKWQPLLDILDLPEDRVFAGAMVTGYPNYRHKQLVDRNPPDVRWASRDQPSLYYCP